MPPSSKKKNADGTSSKKKKAQDDGAMVEYDPEKPSAKQSDLQSSRRPKSSRNHASRDAPHDVDDNVSAISDAEYENDPDDEPRFKYSTAELAGGSSRNTKCCIIAMCILCIIVAIALSIVMVRVFDNKDEENKAPAPTMAPTTESEANQPGLTMFQGTKAFIEDQSCKANSDGCRTACSGFECCDPTLAKNQSCFHFNPEGCLNYKRCHVTTSGIDVPPANLPTICSAQRVASNPEDCQAACGSVRCCWDSDVACYDKFYTCLDYAECQNLRSNALVPAAKPEVEDFCDSGQAGSVTQTDVCENACRPAECCWSEDPAENCLQSELISCLTYDSCGQFNITGAGDVVTLPSASLRNDCSVGNINAGNTAACETACSPGSCCSQGAPNNCFMEDPLACLAYEPCQALTN